MTLEAKTTTARLKRASLSTERMPELVWLIPMVSVLLVLALFVTGPAFAIRMALPLAATITGTMLYFYRPAGYIAFTLWIWFLSPLFRRLVDWRFGFSDQNLVLLTPFLVSSIAVMTLFRERRTTTRIKLQPFLLCLAGVAYGFIVGLIRCKLDPANSVSSAEVLFGFLNWSTPLLLGLHIYLCWSMYEQSAKAVVSTFLWAVLLLGAYGVCQFVVAPAWDCAWLRGLPLGWQNEPFGHPAPFQIRVWSTLNAPGPFANVMVAGLILLVSAKTRFKGLFAAVGYSSLLLSIVRTAWLGWILGIILILTSYRGPALRRSVAGLLLIPLFLAPIAFVPEMTHTVRQRVATLESFAQDGSFKDRTTMYEKLVPLLLKEPAGLGLRNGFMVQGFALDSAILQMFFMLGLAGAALYSSGVALALSTLNTRAARALRRELEPQELAYRVIFFVSLAEVISGNVFVNVTGMMMWVFYGLWMAALAHSGAPLEKKRNKPVNSYPALVTAMEALR